MSSYFVDLISVLEFYSCIFDYIRQSRVLYSEHFNSQYTYAKKLTKLSWGLSGLEGVRVLKGCQS